MIGNVDLRTPFLKDDPPSWSLPDQKYLFLNEAGEPSAVLVIMMTVEPIGEVKVHLRHVQAAISALRIKHGDHPL
ncbi:hypothetical protein BC938DRAFT_473252 [Jimgerdemannia flammicorona]|uniref:Uncharacterized protein n=1 Tax=Jimgerdemannia flammicorona TaxID=994334 RepID=A0A433QTE4_9FUNG|nr:hypothetical protein BC938DRAFT_473252 [Jimgerdemannia flammicorona]